jgi:flagellin
MVLSDQSKENYMSFSINTNIASLQAQNYLSINQAFQSKTINEVTSGLRIVNSGDDAAGLAIANGYRSDEAVLTQGIQNANNGISTLQIMDGGMSNISHLLDRARTLATQSASGTFTGSRTVLDSEFQSVLTEIDRQAQSIGLNQGGIFAQNLSVFIGGGKGVTAAGVISNGSVAVDLSTSTVDTQSLGLKGFTAGYAAGTGQYDLSSGNTTTGVPAIIAANASPLSTTFVLSGPGFGASASSAPVTITVNLTGVGDPKSLVTAINAGIASAVASGAANDQALGTAKISASIQTSQDGSQQLLFSAPNAAFSVTAGDVTANAFLGNLVGQVVAGGEASATGVGKAVSGVGSAATFLAGGTQQTAALTFAANAGGTQTLAFTANNAGGVAQTTSVTVVAAATNAAAAQQINAQLQATDNPTLQSLLAVASSDGTTVTIASNGSSTFNVSIGTDVTGVGTSDTNGFAAASTTKTSSVQGTGATSSIATAAGAQAAVSALASSVATLGSAQASVGRGENQFTYATNLAQSELTNQAAAESGIRDADLAAQAANLTKAQILLQAGVAALAQANAAPQSILSLLK